MINDVRNTVLSVLSKDNRGYVTPEEFNLFAKQAQLEIFEQYFYNYSNHLNKRNARLENSGYSDIPERLAEVIDRFLVNITLTYDTISNKFYAPGDNDILTPKQYQAIRLTYNNNTEIEKISFNKILYLINSNLVAPTERYPVYTLNDYNTFDTASISVYPSSIIDDVTMAYVRHPKDPKWTYVSLSGGEPLFTASATDYQDFELPLSDMPKVAIKILQYAGVSIGENDVVQIMDSKEMQGVQLKN
jgi:hypothetical protein